MSRVFSLILSGILAFLPALSAAAENTAKSLFNGASLQGWTGNTAHWRVEEGAITGEIPAGKSLDHNEFLFWDGMLGDFDLSLEFRISGVRDANSGIQFRSQRRDDGSAAGLR